MSRPDYLHLIHLRRRKPCLRCGKDKWYRLRNRPIYSCSCGKLYSPLKGTIFEGSKTPLETWFQVIQLFAHAKSGMSAAFVQRLVGVTYKCAWRMLHKIRELMRETSKLHGTVEADETFFKAKPWRNSRVAQDKVFNYPTVIGMIERTTGACRVKVIPDLKKDTILRAFSELVAEGSLVRTDGSHAYGGLKRHYYHESRVHWAPTGETMSFKFIPKKGDSTQAIENFWSQLKRGIYGVYRHVKYLQAYCNEYAYRYSHRKENLFEVLLASI